MKQNEMNAQVIILRDERYRRVKRSLCLIKRFNVFSSVKVRSNKEQKRQAKRAASIFRTNWLVIRMTFAQQWKKVQSQKKDFIRCSKLNSALYEKQSKTIFAK